MISQDYMEHLAAYNGLVNPCVREVVMKDQSQLDLERQGITPHTFLEEPRGSVGAWTIPTLTRKQRRAIRRNAYPSVIAKDSLTMGRLPVPHPFWRFRHHV